MTSHARVAHPEAISWETERTDRYNRFRWLVIDRERSLLRPALPVLHADDRYLLYRL